MIIFTSRRKTGFIDAFLLTSNVISRASTRRIALSNRSDSDLPGANGADSGFILSPFDVQAYSGPKLLEFSLVPQTSLFFLRVYPLKRSIDRRCPKVLKACEAVEKLTHRKTVEKTLQ